MRCLKIKVAILRCRFTSASNLPVRLRWFPDLALATYTGITSSADLGQKTPFFSISRPRRSFQANLCQVGITGQLLLMWCLNGMQEQDSNSPADAVDQRFRKRNLVEPHVQGLGHRSIGEGW